MSIRQETSTVLGEVNRTAEAVDRRLQMVRRRKGGAVRQRNGEMGGCGAGFQEQRNKETVGGLESRAGLAESEESKEKRVTVDRAEGGGDAD